MRQRIKMLVEKYFEKNKIEVCEATLYVSIFSSAVCRENPRYCYRIGVVVVRRRRRLRKTLTFCNISVITEDTYLKLGVFTIKRAIQTIKGDN